MEQEAHENKIKMEGEEREQECTAKSGEEDSVTVNVAYLQNIPRYTAAVTLPRGLELNIVHITVSIVTAPNVRVILDWYT